jgi:hypothetical protein
LEPPLDGLLDDLPEAQPVRDEWRQAFVRMREAYIAQRNGIPPA